MSVLKVPLVRWAIGLTSASIAAAIGYVAFDGPEQLVVYLVAAAVLVGEPFVLKQVAHQQ
jgi:hypothetical protein